MVGEKVAVTCTGSLHPAHSLPEGVIQLRSFTSPTHSLSALDHAPGKDLVWDLSYLQLVLVNCIELF